MDRMARKKRPPAPSAKSTAASTAAVEVAIEAMGAQGHGVARTGGRTLHVPFTLPGERVFVQRDGSRGMATAIHIASPDRVTALCRHFGECGGCALQHWSEAAYRAWKEGLVTSALARAGIEVAVEPLRTYPVPSRRRATFTASRAGKDIQLGYLAARSHTLVDLEECPILVPRIASALPALRGALATAMPALSEAKLSIAAAVNGLDCSVEGPPPRAGAQAQIIEALTAAGFIRALWNGEVLLQAAAPFVLCGGVRVMLPPDAFLQAVESCEQDMANWVLEALSEAKAIRNGPVCDLFAGLGAFTFPAAKLAPVTAYEQNSAAVEALAAAARQAKGLKPVNAVRRDLFRNPLGPLELGRFAAAILDPPREGAETQCRTLAASKASAVAMMSCNPASFARDAAILTGGGFHLSRLAAFDQFCFSAHVEIAALFVRPSGRRS